jgi:hypothetical protein
VLLDLERQNCSVRRMGCRTSVVAALL